jgi:hypothetical protein
VDNDDDDDFSPLIKLMMGFIPLERFSPCGPQLINVQQHLGQWW